MTIHLSVLLWERSGRAAELIAYEDEVLTLLEHHGGRVVSRVRRIAGEDGPLESQLIELPSQGALDDYMVDERRLALADRRDAAIERTEIQRVESIDAPRTNPQG